MHVNDCGESLFVSILSSLHLTQPLEKFRRPRSPLTFIPAFCSQEKMYVVEMRGKNNPLQGLNPVIAYEQRNSSSALLNALGGGG